MADQNQFKAYSFPKEKFELVGRDRVMKDEKFDTKPVSYMRDALRRFARNKASVFAAVTIGVLLLFAIFGPFLGKESYTSAYSTDTSVINYQYLTPRLSFMAGTGFWDGTKKESISRNKYDIYLAMEIERGFDIVSEPLSVEETTDLFGKTSALYTVRTDTYTALNTRVSTLSAEQYRALMQWQDENKIQVILPWVDSNLAPATDSNPNIWFKSDRKGNATLDAEGNFIPAYVTSGNDDYTSVMRLASDPYNQGDTEHAYRYAKRTGTAAAGNNYVVRMNSYNAFIYYYGFEPTFIFGTNEKGYDIFTRLASGARFSFLLAITVSAINLFIGAIYGAIEGYYGGVTDILMERVSDILSGIPFMVVTVLFKMHLASKVGIVPALLFAFVLTGWIGMASRVRMQFYRFKNQEYILAARTLGARDFRIMFKHIFPNSLGTIITGSILVIPSVIFSETSLSYLGIVNLDSTTMSSIGSMLSAGQSCMTVAPHVVLFPAIFIGLLMISFNLFGNGLRDAFNPSLRGVEE